MSRFFSFFLLILRIEVGTTDFPTEGIANKNPIEKSKLILILSGMRKALVSRKKKKIYINELQMELSTSYTSRKRSS